MKKAYMASNPVNENKIIRKILIYKHLYRKVIIYNLFFSFAFPGYIEAGHLN